MKRIVSALCVIAVVALLPVILSNSAQAGVHPSVTGMSKHKSTYWGGPSMTVYGRNFTRVKYVLFGKTRGHGVHVVSPGKLTVHVPWHNYGRVHLRVVTSSGSSTRTGSDWFTFTHPTMRSHIQGGLTGNQEKSISSHVRRVHRNAYLVHRSRSWTAAMGASAVARARSWMGLPYSWAGGNGYGPTTGVCAHNGGDLDCHISGFDCSGLTLYSWWPYKHMAHYAATQRSQAGRFHPAIGQLMPGDLVFFSGYISGGIGHVAIYEGNGNVIEAEQSGTVVHRARLVDVIRASGTYRGATRPLAYGRQGAVPSVRSMTTQVSARGGYVTINGANLANATSVTISGKISYSFARRTASQLVVRVPAHSVGRGSIVVSNSWGSVTRSVAYVGTPTLTSLSTTRGVTTGGTSVTLAGTNLTAITKVLVGTTAVRWSAPATNRLLITMPAHAAGTAPVRVYTRFGTSNFRTFTYFAPAPPSTSSARVSTPSTPSSTPPATTTAPSSVSSTPPATTTPPSSTPSTPESSPSTPPSTTTGPPSTSDPSASSSAPSAATATPSGS